MTFEEVQLGDKVSRMICGKPLMLGMVVGKDEHGAPGPPQKGPTLHVQIEGGKSVAVTGKEFEEWTVLRG